MQGHQTKDELAERLLQCLDTEMALSDQLLSLSKEQQKALINRRDEYVEKISAAQDAKLRQLSSARKRSESAAVNLAETLGVETSELTLSRLAASVDDPLKTRIEDKVMKLVKSASSLYEQNTLNKNLLAGAVHYISFCLRVFSGGDEQVQYTPGSSVRMRPNALILDRTV